MSKTNKKCLGIITARGGSKGVPRKNIRKMNGKPLIHYSIDLAKACPYITKILVTTDDPEIRKVSIEGGAEAPFLRPAELSTDLAHQEDAILHAMDWCEAQGERYDRICLLAPNHPLGRVETLNKAFELLESRPDAEAVFSITPANVYPERCGTLRPDGLMKDWGTPESRWLNRQEMPVAYKLSGFITLSDWKAFRREKTFLHDKTLQLPVDYVECWDINVPFDFFVAESLLQKGFTDSAQLADHFRLPAASAK